MKSVWIKAVIQTCAWGGFFLWLAWIIKPSARWRCSRLPFKERIR
jgi:hypothetical protein